MDQHDCYLWAAQRCSVKEYCRTDIVTKLLAKGASNGDAQAVADRLEKEKYLNDERYVRAFVADKFRFDHWGKQKIAQALRLKGFSSQEVDEAFHETVSEEDYAEALHDFLAAKLRTTKADTPFAQRQKVARSAISRGFEPHLVFKALSLDDF